MRQTTNYDDIMDGGLLFRSNNNNRNKRRDVKLFNLNHKQQLCDKNAFDTFSHRQSARRVPSFDINRQLDERKIYSKYGRSLNSKRDPVFHVSIPKKQQPPKHNNSSVKLLHIRSQDNRNYGGLASLKLLQLNKLTQKDRNAQSPPAYPLLIKIYDEHKSNKNSDQKKGRLFLRLPCSTLPPKQVDKLKLFRGSILHWNKYEKEVMNMTTPQNTNDVSIQAVIEDERIQTNTPSITSKANDLAPRIDTDIVTQQLQHSLTFSAEPAVVQYVNENATTVSELGVFESIDVSTTPVDYLTFKRVESESSKKHVKFDSIDTTSDTLAYFSKKLKEDIKKCDDLFPIHEKHTPRSPVVSRRDTSVEDVSETSALSNSYEDEEEDWISYKRRNQTSTSILYLKEQLKHIDSALEKQENDLTEKVIPSDTIPNASDKGVYMEIDESELSKYLERHGLFLSLMPVTSTVVKKNGYDLHVQTNTIESNSYSVAESINDTNSSELSMRSDLVAPGTFDLNLNISAMTEHSSIFRQHEASKIPMNTPIQSISVVPSAELSMNHSKPESTVDQSDPQFKSVLKGKLQDFMKRRETIPIDGNLNSWASSSHLDSLIGKTENMITRTDTMQHEVSNMLLELQNYLR